MCDDPPGKTGPATRTVPVTEAVGTVLAHDITEIRPGEFKGRAFRKGHIIREADVCRLQRLGKEHLFVLSIAEDEMHEDEAAFELARAVMGSGVGIKDDPSEGKIDIVAVRDGLLKIDREALLRINMLGDVMCATLHTNTVVKQGRIIAGTRAIPLIVKRAIVEQAKQAAAMFPTGAASPSGRGRTGRDTTGVIEVKELRPPRAGVVITGNEVYHGRIRDAFAPVISKKIEKYGGKVVGLCYAPDDRAFIAKRLSELLDAGADLLITTGGMSVDPDDVTRFAIRDLGAADITYGSAVLPGSMFLVAYIDPVSRQKSNRAETSERTHSPVPILGIPACGMYARTTVFDLVLPRILAGEFIGRKELAELGHGGLCLKCETCRYPVCPLGK